MEIYNNGLVSLYLDPATFILHAELPDFESIILTEVCKSFAVITEAVKHHDVRKLLLDSTKTIVNVSEDEYKMVMTKFCHDLIATRLEKVARLTSNDTVKEKKVDKFLSEFIAEVKPTAKFQNFNNEREAVNWLMSKKK
ncbi:hypothetical protein ACFSKU_17315 [Pontibacter silvestris]|uniref:STAS/SEC14 domain-containing protein n=1 Tax=Pontibacter silvestris TaxID=2305183 RepID=A0ABW4X3C7_9BACT|nr:hypothetical protein [Pontibacter silvestris]MCC9135783.1 hypothetical protein [Pontibacter silvestris]